MGHALSAAFGCFVVAVAVLFGGATHAGNLASTAGGRLLLAQNDSQLDALEFHYYQELHQYLTRSTRPLTMPGDAASLPLENEIVFGRENAPITVVSYISLSCQNCRAWMEELFQPLNDKYVKTGRVRHVIRLFPFTFEDAIASLALGCMQHGHADLFRNGFEAFYERVYEKEGVIEVARQAGFDDRALDRCWTAPRLDGLFAQMTEALEQCPALNCPREAESDGKVYARVPVPFSLIGSASPSGEFTYHHFTTGAAPERIAGFFATIEEYASAQR